MNSRAKRAVRRLVNSLGYEVTRFNPKGSDRARLLSFFSWQEINIVLDIGANVGQYGLRLRDLGYKGRIVSFEPVLVAHRALEHVAARDREWVVAPPTALGDRDGAAVIHVSEDTVYSSVLEGLNVLSSTNPTSRLVGEQDVRMTTLDSVCPRYVLPNDNVFVKADVQGFERQVLAGAAKTLQRARGVQLELSFVTLYEGEAPFRTMMDLMESLGFVIHSLAPVWADEDTGREVQADVIFQAANAGQQYREIEERRSRARTEMR